jgi:hypothetical protein
MAKRSQSEYKCGIVTLFANVIFGSRGLAEKKYYITG